MPLPIGASYPLTNDRFVQRNKLTGCRERGGASRVALSSDGNIALISCQEDTPNGAALVFRRTGSAWKRQGELTGSGESLHGNFGYSVALSGDGKTALIGSTNDNDGIEGRPRQQRRGLGLQAHRLDLETAGQQADRQR